MTMIYRGPRSGLSLRVGASVVDVALIDGQAPEGLPPDHPMLAQLQARGLAVDIPDPAPVMAAKTAPAAAEPATPQEDK
jgi:hypothetical protein